MIFKNLNEKLIKKYSFPCDRLRNQNMKAVRPMINIFFFSNKGCTFHNTVCQFLFELINLHEMKLHFFFNELYILQHDGLFFKRKKLFNTLNVCLISQWKYFLFKDLMICWMNFVTCKLDTIVGRTISL